MADSGTELTAIAGPFTLKAALDPDPPGTSGNSLVLRISDASGKSIDDATVEVFTDMAAMGAMSEMKSSAKVSHDKDGRYRATFDLPMAGSWTLKVSVHSPAGDATQDFTITVGAKGLSALRGSGAAMPSATGPISSTPGEIDHYTCSMHPSVNQHSPGKCPICGMDTIAVTKEQQEQGVVMIDAVRRQLIGVRTGQVIEGPMKQTFRAVGVVAYDEAALADVNLKVRGWITKLFVNKTGERVTKGQTLFLMYSPELYNAEQDFLLATRGAPASTSLGTSDSSDAGPSRIDGLARAARQRLHLLGLADSEIDAVAKSGAPHESVPIAAPASGFVIEKNVVEGALIDPGMRLYRIAALNKVWVEADVYEGDFANVRVGQTAVVTLDYLPDQKYDARVAYVYPYLDTKTRTGRVRIELANKDLELHPGMYANVELTTDLGRRTQVPAAAVVYTGPRRLVFVDLGEGRFLPKEVKLGTEADGMVEVLSGLAAGDVVATSGVFLIAAEARISTAAKYWDKSPEVDGDLEAAPKGSR